jgi:hypothetical protein
MGERMERDLNWQIVNLNVNPAELLDAPILYISGDQPLRFSAKDKDKLRSFVQQGGMILGQADCGKAAFAKSFRELGADLFGYEFRALPPAHPVFTEQYPATKWKGRIEVEGLSNGVRELMILIPKEDVARSWQTRATKQHHFELAANIFLYAVDKSNLRYKGDTFVLTPKPDAKPTKTIKVARIRYGGNWDPEPGGWIRLGTFMLNNYGMGLEVKPVTLSGAADVASSASNKSQSPLAAKQKPARSEGHGRTSKSTADGSDSAPASSSSSLKGFTVAHLTGTTAFHLSDDAREQLRAFVEAGGTLIVDAAGGSGTFADSAEQELGEIFKGGEAAKDLDKPLDAKHDFYKVTGTPMKEFGFRTFAKTKLGNATRGPRVRGGVVDMRTAVFFSPEDITAGLVGQPVDGIYGYDPRTATQLAANMLLYAANGGKPITTQPTTQPAAK